jgi:hypothetical protein
MLWVRGDRHRRTRAIASQDVNELWKFVKVRPAHDMAEASKAGPSCTVQRPTGLPQPELLIRLGCAACRRCQTTASRPH